MLRPVSFLNSTWKTFSFHITQLLFFAPICNIAYANVRSSLNALPMKTKLLRRSGMQTSTRKRSIGAKGKNCFRCFFASAIDELPPPLSLSVLCSIPGSASRYLFFCCYTLHLVLPSPCLSVCLFVCLGNDSEIVWLTLSYSECVCVDRV